MIIWLRSALIPKCLPRCLNRFPRITTVPNNLKLLLLYLHGTNPKCSHRIFLAVICDHYLALDLCLSLGTDLIMQLNPLVHSLQAPCFLRLCRSCCCERTIRIKSRPSAIQGLWSHLVVRMSNSSSSNSSDPNPALLLRWRTYEIDWLAVIRCCLKVIVVISSAKMILSIDIPWLLGSTQTVLICSKFIFNFVLILWTSNGDVVR